MYSTTILVEVSSMNGNLLSLGFLSTYYLTMTFTTMAEAIINDIHDVRPCLHHDHDNMDGILREKKAFASLDFGLL